MGIFQDETAIKCDQLHQYNKSEQCQFVLNNSDCQNVDGFFNYITLIYCDYKLAPTVAIVILAIWIFVLFSVIAVTTDSFFCPTLDVISKALRLSQNVAGVTILAFGNGVSDIFVSIAATSQDRPELIISDLFGGGMFVSCVVFGTIMIFSHYRFEMPPGPFLRDTAFYLIATFWAFAIYYNQKVTLFDALGLLVLYVIYVSAVILGPKLYERFWLLQGAVFDDENTGVPDGTLDVGVEDSINRPLTDFVSDRMITNDDNDFVPLWQDNDDSEGTPLLGANIRTDHRQGKGRSFLRALMPVDVEKWPTEPWYSRVSMIIQAPAVFALKLTVPVVDKGVPKHNWCQILNSLHWVTGPMFTVFAVRCATIMIGGMVPIWAIVLGVGLAVSLVVFCITTDQPPRFHTVFAFLGFTISIVWIYILANEIVNALKTIGIILGINDVILGLTVLAWGNSVGDFIANLTVARNGSPTMAVSACIGGPLMNLLVGMGLPFTIKVARQGHHITVKYDSSITILSGFLFASLVSTMLAMVILKFQVRRSYGIYLLILYAAFMLCAILNAVHII